MTPTNEELENELYMRELQAYYELVEHNHTLHTKHSTS